MKLENKVALVTGAGSGIGRAIVERFIAEGARVVASDIRADRLDEVSAALNAADALKTVTGNVADRGDIGHLMDAAAAFGRLDIVVNNAGYGHFGFVEELTEAEARAQLETNLFGALWVTQAALPYLRAQRSGHIIQVSSIGGITAFPLVGIYHASKWALEGLSQSLAQEVAGFGIHVTLIEPGGFDTDWSGPSSTISQALPDYAELHQQVAEVRKQRWAKPGDPKASAAALLKVVDAERPPLRVFFGETPLQTARADYESRLANWEQWQPVAVQAQG